MTSKNDDFTRQLAGYKARIENSLAPIARQLERETKQHYGSYPSKVVKAYTSVLLRGGKRLRGALAINSYEMFGGTNKELIDQAAAGLELLNTYILIIDDIQDRSELRRGGPTAHRILSGLHKKDSWSGDSEHNGRSLALNAALIGVHTAEAVFADLPTSPEKRLQVLHHVNQTIITTAHGQTVDITNEVKKHVSNEDAHNVLVWKTAHYSFMNPIIVGHILADGSEKDKTALLEYGLHAGKLFQLVDDIQGIFGDEVKLGKNPFDDIREGNRSLLILNTLESARGTDKDFFTSMLGNQDINKNEFMKCREIIRKSGALNNIRKVASREAAAAKKIVEQQKWSHQQGGFLDALVDKLLAKTNV